MTSTKRPALIGAALAVVVVALAVSALAMRARPGAGGVGSTSAAPSKVVVVFAMQGEDRAVTAQMVAVADTATGRWELQDTSSTVSIPGTSYSMLRDAYPFGGAQAVAAAIDGGAIKPGTAWVDVSPDGWRRLLAAGVDVTITAPFDTFDEATDAYTEFETGARHVAPAELWSLVNGVAYLDAAERASITDALAAASMRALASAAATQGIDTNLSPAQWAAFAKGLAK